MNLNLDHLYQQIMDTEQQVHNRVAHVAELKRQMETVKAELKKTEEESLMTRRQIDVEKKRLVEETAKNEWAKNKLQIVTEQRDRAKEKHVSLCQQLKSVESQTAAGRERFAAEVNEFCENYDLCSGGKDAKRLAAVDLIRQLTRDVQKTEAEVSTLRQKVELKRQKQQKKNKPNECMDSNGVCRYKQQLLDMQKQLELKAAAVTELEAEKTRVSLIPQTDPEYTRLAGELGRARAFSAASEDDCSSLRHQLQQLQQQQWQQARRHHQ